MPHQRRLPIGSLSARKPGGVCPGHAGWQPSSNAPFPPAGPWARHSQLGALLFGEQRVAAQAGRHPHAQAHPGCAHTKAAFSGKCAPSHDPRQFEGHRRCSPPAVAVRTSPLRRTKAAVAGRPSWGPLKPASRSGWVAPCSRGGSLGPRPVSLRRAPAHGRHPGPGNGCSRISPWRCSPHPFRTMGLLCRLQVGGW